MSPDSKCIVGFTAGSWDFVHAGHVLHFEECKRHCDYLIVGLQIDPSVDRQNKNEPVLTLLERQLMLRAVRWIDEVIVYKTEAGLHLLDKALNIDVRFMGEDHQGKRHHPTARVIYTRRQHPYSSSNIRARL